MISFTQLLICTGRRCPSNRRPLMMGGSGMFFANTGLTPPNDVYAPGDEPLLGNQKQLLLGGRSTIILFAR